LTSFDDEPQEIANAATRAAAKILIAFIFVILKY
jgi:hypothetical protein